MNKEKYSQLISKLNALYKSVYKSISNIGIPLLLIPILCSLIAGVCMSDAAIKYGARDIIWWFYTDEQLPVYWYLPLLGFAGLDPSVARDRIDIIIEYVRVSTLGQSDNTGKQRQKNELAKEISNINYTDKIRISDEWESASTMLRENIDKIVETIRNHPEKTPGLMLESSDRLSRAPPFEAATFLWILSRFDVVVYFGDLGYFDFSDPNQQMMAFFGLYRSRQEFNNIKERTSSGQKQIKEKGGLPHKTPFGYNKIDGGSNDAGDSDKESHKVEINELEAEVIREAVEQIIETEEPVIKKIWRDLKEKYENDVENFPNYSSLRYILRNRKYTGEVNHHSEVVGEIPQIVSQEDYNRVIEKIGTPDNSENDDLDHALRSVIDRFGIDGSIQLFDIIKGQCPRCGGEVVTEGSAERWGNRVLTYRCIGITSNTQETTEHERKNRENDDNSESTEEGCGYNGPLLNRSFLQKWDPGLPIVCPRCQTPADANDWERVDWKLNVVKQICDECGLWYSADLDTDHDSPIQRGMDFPDQAISFFDDTDGKSNNEDRDDTDGKSNNEDRDDDGKSSDSEDAGSDNDHKELSKFG